MEEKKYLRQLVTGRIYIRTEALAKLKDMVPFDPDVAKKRIDAIKKRIEDGKAAQAVPGISAEDLAVASELTGLENQIEEDAERELELENATPITQSEKPKTKEEVDEEQHQRKIDSDPEIISVRKMRSKAEVAEYMVTEFGEEVEDPASHKLEELKEKAVALRTDRIFEE